MPSEFEIRPQTYALDALIRRTIAKVLHSSDVSSADALLFLGNGHQAFPTLLVQDPVLEPVDKIVWMVICRQGGLAGAGTAFPSYATIARQANIASTATVSRAIAILRATRWLSLCARVRDRSGRYRGNVYALHDEPLPLADALHLDANYMNFVKDATRHHHARVRRVAAAVLTCLDDDIAAGRDILAPENAMARRITATQAMKEPGSNRYFSFSARVLSRLTSRNADHPGDHQDQKSKSASNRLRILHPQNSKAVGCSSSNNKKTTTTTTATKNSKADETLAGLVYPARLSANQRELASRSLATIPEAQRQAVLDELAGRLCAERQGAKPVYDELRYLHRLCARVNAGDFQPNLGLKVQEARKREALAQAQRRTAAQAVEETRRQRRMTDTSGDSPLAEVRRLLKMPPTGRAKPSET